MSTEIPAFVCSHVFEKRRPVLLVMRADGDWQFLCGEEDHDMAEIPHAVGLNHLVDDDARLEQVLDLLAGWEAERAAVDSSWVRRQIE